MTDLLFGQSYFLIFDPKLWQAMLPYPPLGTLYAASFARENGYNVALFDAMLAQSEDEWAEALDREKPEFAIIYEDSFNYLSKMCLLRMREAAFTMIDMARRRGISTIICGSDATDHSESYLESGADFVILGEGDLPVALAPAGHGPLRQASTMLSWNAGTPLVVRPPSLRLLTQYLLACRP